MTDANLPTIAAYERLKWYALAAGVTALGLCVLAAVVGQLVFHPPPGKDEGSFLGWVFSRAQFFRSYLVAYVFVLGIALGSLAILGVHHLTGGVWGLVIRRVLEAATRTLPLLAVLFLPLLLGLWDLYPWARWTPEEVAGSEMLRHKREWLAVPWFLVRAAVYFAAWLVVTFFLNRWSAQHDVEGDPRYLRRSRMLGGPVLILYGLAITFASIDWLMSIEPMWYSTIYGVLVATGQVVAAFSFATAVLILLASYPPLATVVGRPHMRDLGSLLMAFVMVWAYIAFSQYLLIWAGNLPEEIPWY